MGLPAGHTVAAVVADIAADCFVDTHSVDIHSADIPRRGYSSPVGAACLHLAVPARNMYLPLLHAAADCMP